MLCLPRATLNPVATSALSPQSCRTHPPAERVRASTSLARQRYCARAATPQSSLIPPPRPRTSCVGFDASSEVTEVGLGLGLAG